MAESNSSKDQMKEILYLVRSMENQFSAFGLKVKGIEQRLDSMDGRLRIIEQRLDLIEQRLDRVEVRLAGIERYMDPAHADLPRAIPRVRAQKSTA